MNYFFVIIVYLNIHSVQSSKKTLFESAFSNENASPPLFNEHEILQESFLKIEEYKKKKKTHFQIWNNNHDEVNDLADFNNKLQQEKNHYRAHPDNRDLSSSIAYVGTEQELNDALGSYYPAIELNADIHLNDTVYIFYSVSIEGGNHFRIVGLNTGTLNFRCFLVFNAVSVIFNNISIDGCGGSQGGGMLIADASTHVTMTSSSMSDHVAEYGGALLASDFTTLILTDVIFSNNYAKVTGGAILSSSAHVYFYRVSLILNSAKNGGAYNAYKTVGEIHHSNISYNKAEEEIGGIGFLNSNFTVWNTTFSGNYGAYCGAVGVFSPAANVNMYSSTFISNKAKIVAGAIAVGTQGILNLHHGEITSNVATSGGAIAVAYGTLNLYSVDVMNNTAESTLTFELIEGDCSVSNGCFYSGNYPKEYSNDEKCVFQAKDNGTLSAHSFYTESDTDVLIINNVSYSGYTAPNCVDVNPLSNITWSSNDDAKYPGFELCFFELVTGGGAAVINGGGLNIYDSRLFYNSATRVGGTFEITNDGDVSLYGSSLIVKDYEIMAPIHFVSGTFDATNLYMTGNLEGNSAVISTCDSACGKGKIGSCSTAGSFAPDCQINCECIDCASGFYSIAAGASTDVCLSCPEGRSSYAGSATCDIAAEGYYISRDNTSEVCPDHADCDGGHEWPRPLSGYYIDRRNVHVAKLLNKCYRKTCVGSTNHSSGESSCWVSSCYKGARKDTVVTCSEHCSDGLIQCKEGSGGILCGSCSYGYTYSSTTQTCVGCSVKDWGKDTSFLICLIVTCFVILIGLVRYWKLNQHNLNNNTNSSDVDIGINWIECRLPKMIQYFVEMISIQNKSGVLRVLWVNFQIIQSIAWTVQIDFPTPFRGFLSSLSILSFDLFIIDCLPGGVYTSVYVWSLVPIGLTIINQIICEVRVWMEKKRPVVISNNNERRSNSVLSQDDDDDDDSTSLQYRIAKIKNSHFSAFLMLIFSLLPPVLRKQFVYLDCFSFYHDKLLRIDTAVDCKSAEYQSFRVFDILAIMTYMTIPIYWIWLLHRQKALLNPPVSDDFPGI